MRASTITIAAALVFACLVIAACDRQQEESEPADGEAAVAEQERASESEEEENSDLVAAGGPLEISTEEAIEAVHRLRLLSPGVEDGEIPASEPEWMKMPQAQVDVMQNLVHYAVVRHAADEREFEITDEDELEALAEHPRLQRYLPLFEAEEDTESEEIEELQGELAEVDLGVDDVRRLIHDVIYENRLTDELAEEFPDDSLWGVYQNAYDRASLVVVRIHNAPTSDEVDRAVRQYDREIRAHYRENRDNYRTPVQLVATTLVVDREVDESEVRELLEEAADRMADEDPKAIADDLGLLHTEEVRLSQQRHQQILASETGDTGIAVGSQGPFAWRLDQRIDSESRSLDRPLRREIGSVILRQEEGITPSKRVLAQQAQRLLAEPEPGDALDEEEVQALITTLESEGFDATYTDLFSIRLAGAIPEIGLAENLIDVVRETDLDDPVTEPTLDRQSVFVARLVDRRHPDRDAFEEEREEFRREFLEENRQRLLQQHVASFRRDHEVDVNLRPMRDHFGVLDKKPAVPPSVSR